MTVHASEKGRLYLLGDVHGNSGFVRQAVENATERGAELILQLGDFGYWEHTPDGVRFLDDLESVLQTHDLELWFIDGNHENHDLLANLERDERGLGIVREHIRHIPRGWRCSFQGYEWGFVGGAFSIDYRMRTMGWSIWRGEQTTLDDIDRLGRGSLDVLCAHDVFTGVDLDLVCPTRMNVPESDERQAQETRYLLSEAVRATKPKRYFHGHWHNFYEHRVGRVEVCGLGAENLKLGTRLVGADGSPI